MDITVFWLIGFFIFIFYANIKPSTRKTYKHMHAEKGNEFEKDYFEVEVVDRFDEKYLRNILNLEKECFRGE